MSPIQHGDPGSFSGNLPFKLCKDHDDEHHGLSHRGRTVYVFIEADELNIVLFEELPEVRKVQDTACDPVELDADDGINLTFCDINLEPLKLGAILVLRTFAPFDVDLDRNTLGASSILQVPGDGILLGFKTVSLHFLSRRGNSDVRRYATFLSRLIALFLPVHQPASFPLEAKRAARRAAA